MLFHGKNTPVCNHFFYFDVCSYVRYLQSHGNILLRSWPQIVVERVLLPLACYHKDTRALKAELDQEQQRLQKKIDSHMQAYEKDKQTCEGLYNKLVQLTAENRYNSARSRSFEFENSPEHEKVKVDCAVEGSDGAQRGQQEKQKIAADTEEIFASDGVVGGVKDGEPEGDDANSVLNKTPKQKKKSLRKSMLSKLKRSYSNPKDDGPDPNHATDTPSKTRPPKTSKTPTSGKESKQEKKLLDKY